MRVLKIIAAAALIVCSAWLVSCDVERINDTPMGLDRAINISSDGSRYILAGDTIRCDDGSNYAILNADEYPDCSPPPSVSLERLQGELPEGEAIHYEDDSGDYLFVCNLYETLRMAYTVYREDDCVDIQLTVPEDILSDAFSPWDPERVNGLANDRRSDIVCIEAWDMFKNGVYYKTVYEIGVDRKEAGHE